MYLLFGFRGPMLAGLILSVVVLMIILLFICEKAQR